MKTKRRVLGVSAILLIILVLIVQECDAGKFGSSRKTSSGRGKSTGSNSGSGSSGSWWSRVTGGSSGSASSASKVSSSSATHKKPEPSAPRLEEKKPIGWNVPGTNSNPGAPPAYSNTHTRGLSNPSQQNPPPYSKNSPAGHQTMQSNNNPHQYQGSNYPHNTGQQYSGYPGGQGGHYPGMNYGAGGYAGHSGYSPASSGYFASGYPVGNSNYGRSSSGSTLTNALLAGTVGLGLYNAIRQYPSYSGGGYGGGGYGGGGAYGGGGSTVHNHYYNNQGNQGVGANTNAVQNPAQAPAPAIPSNQNTNAVQTPLAPMPPQANNSASASDPTAALVTPPPPTLAPDEKITDLDCVYAMKILNCSEISQCPQEWLHPSCLNRNISKEYYDSITLPPPPPIPQTQPETNLDGKASLPNDLTSAGQNQNGNRDQSIYSSANGQQQSAVVSSSNSSSRATTTEYSLCLTIILGIATLKNKF